MTPPKDRPPRRKGSGGGGRRGRDASKRSAARKGSAGQRGARKRSGDQKGARKGAGGRKGAGKASGSRKRAQGRSPAPAPRSGRDDRGRSRRDRSEEELDPRTRGWGRVARRGAERLNDSGASQAFRDAVEEETPVDWEPERWVDEGPVRDEAERAVERGRRRPRDRTPPSEPDPDTGRISKALRGERAERAAEDVRKAARAFQREHFKEAEKLLRPLVELVPDDVTVRELYGLTLYRLERWKAAAGHLERFAELTGSVEQHPVLADCRRALGHHRKVAELWDELREQQAPAAIMAEGRIVLAGDLADRGELDRAIREMERSSYEAKRPKDHHLRLRYVLADLYERAGDLPRAREMFESVARHDTGFADVATRLRQLG